MTPHDKMNKSPMMKNTVWIMRTADGFYPIQPSIFCKPEDHGRMNDHVLKIEDKDGKTLWERAKT